MMQQAADPIEAKRKHSKGSGVTPLGKKKRFSLGDGAAADDADELLELGENQNPQTRRQTIGVFKQRQSPRHSPRRSPRRQRALWDASQLDDTGDSDFGQADVGAQDDDDDKTCDIASMADVMALAMRSSTSSAANPSPGARSEVSSGWGTPFGGTAAHSTPVDKSLMNQSEASWDDEEGQQEQTEHRQAR